MEIRTENFKKGSNSEEGFKSRTRIQNRSATLSGLNKSEKTLKSQKKKKKMKNPPKNQSQGTLGYYEKG